MKIVPGQPSSESATKSAPVIVCFGQTTEYEIEDTPSERAHEMIRNKPFWKVVLSPDPTDACPILIGAGWELGRARVEYADIWIVINFAAGLDRA